MSGERCKNFIRSLDICKLKSITVTIKRSNIPQPDYPQPIYRGLEDRKNLKVHFKSESLHGIFDREDIIINQEYSEETASRSESRNNERGLSDEKKSHKERNSSRYEDLSKDNPKHHNRSRSRSCDSHKIDSVRCRRERSRSSSYQRHSPSPKATSSKNYSKFKRKRSRSHSPNSPPVKIPGLYIPPKSDYLRYEKRKTERSDRSRSPELKHRTKFQREKRSRSLSKDHDRSKSPYGEHSSTSKQYVRSGYRKKSRSRSLSIEKSRGRPSHRTASESPERVRLRKRFEEQKDYKIRDEANTISRSSRRSRSRSPNDKRHSPKGRNYRNRSPRRGKEYSRRRSRSHSRNRDRIMEDSIYFQQNIQPYIIKDGEYWIPAGSIAGPGYIPRGYIPPNMLFPRGFHPPLMMPRLPIMQPFRPRIYRPRMYGQNNITSTVTNSQKENEQNVQKYDSENPNNLQLSEVPVAKESSVTIGEISSEKAESLEKC